MKFAGKTALAVLFFGLSWIWIGNFIEHSSASELFSISGVIEVSILIVALSLLVFVMLKSNSRSRPESGNDAYFQNNPSPMLICSITDLNILESNLEASKLLGFTNSELKKKTFDSLRNASSDSSIASIERLSTRHKKPIIVQTRLSELSDGSENKLLVSLNDITETEELKNALLQRERMSDSLIQSENAYLIRINSDGEYDFANEAFIKRFKNVSSTFIGTHYKDTVHRDDIEKCEAAAEEAARNPGKVVSVKLRKPIGDDKYIQTSWELLATMDNHGEVNGVQGMGRDSTDEDDYRDQERKSRTQLNMLLESILDGFFILNRNLDVQLANQRFANLLEKPLDEIIGLNLKDVLPNFQNTRSSIEFPEAIKHQKSTVFEAYNPFFDLWFSVNAYPFEGGLAVFYRDITERKENEMEVKVNEVNLKSLINTTRDFIWSIDSNFQILTANSAVGAIFKKLRGVEIEKGQLALPPDSNPEVAAMLKPLYEKALAGFHVSEQISTIGIPDLDMLVDLRMSPIRDNEDNILGIACYGRDVTEIETQRNALIQSVEKYEALAEVTQDAIWELNFKDDWVKWSVGLFETFGYDLQKTQLDWWPTMIHPKDVDRVTSSLDKSLEGTDRVWAEEYRFKRKDGKYRWVADRGVIHRDKKGKPIKMIGSIQDITMLKDSLKEVQKLSLVAEKTSTGVLITDAKGKVEWCNEAFEVLSGYSLTEMIGKKPGDILQGQETNQETVKRVSEAISAGNNITEELINYHKSGRKYWVRMTISPVFKNDKINRFIAIETDISQEKKVEERLQSQNKNLRKIAFILSHELRKPVSSILGLLALYDETDPSGKMNKDIIKYLNSATTELDEMIHEIIKQSALIDE